MSLDYAVHTVHHVHSREAAKGWDGHCQRLTYRDDCLSHPNYFSGY
ncbi:MAG: hypothetical protein GX574_00605 [Lentisphaerae bacterium]|nr:hypothetical protein [Lentisphaerota bacterium]